MLHEQFAAGENPEMRVLTARQASEKRPGARGRCGGRLSPAASRCTPHLAYLAARATAPRCICLHAHLC